MKNSTAYLLYGVVGLVTGLAVSLLGWSGCTATVGDIIVARPPNQSPTAVFTASFVAESAARSLA
jgi:hypothetical protein